MNDPLIKCKNGDTLDALLDQKKIAVSMIKSQRELAAGLKSKYEAQAEVLSSQESYLMNLEARIEIWWAEMKPEGSWPVGYNER